MPVSIVFTLLYAVFMLEILKGAMSPGFCCFSQILCWSHYAFTYMYRKMFLWNCEGDCETNVIGSINHNKMFW